jgi:hypothetical protein
LGVHDSYTSLLSILLSLTYLLGELVEEFT